MAPAFHFIIPDIRTELSAAGEEPTAAGKEPTVTTAADARGELSSMVPPVTMAHIRSHGCRDGSGRCHPRSRMARRSRRHARSVKGTPRCTVSSSCVVTRCSPRTSCPLTRAKAWCQSVMSLVMDRASIASAPAPIIPYGLQIRRWLAKRTPRAKISTPVPSAPGFS
jgi:hypothetical protein